MKIRTYIIMLAAAFMLLGTAEIQRAQAQTVEMPDKGISVWVPDRFTNGFDMSTSKRFDYKSTEASENDSTVRVEIINSDDSVEKLMQEQSKWAFQPSDIVSQQSFTDADGNEQAYVMYTRKCINTDLKGYIFMNLGNGEKLQISASMPKTESNQQDFQDIMNSITYDKAKNPTSHQDSYNCTTHTERHGFSFGFHLGIW